MKKDTVVVCTVALFALVLMTSNSSAEHRGGEVHPTHPLSHITPIDVTFNASQQAVTNVSRLQLSTGTDSAGLVLNNYRIRDPSNSFVYRLNPAEGEFEYLSAGVDLNGNNITQPNVIKSGGQNITLRDSTNQQDIIRAKEGGNVTIPSGDLELNGNVVENAERLDVNSSSNDFLSVQGNYTSTGPRIPHTLRFDDRDLRIWSGDAEVTAIRFDNETSNTEIPNNLDVSSPTGTGGALDVGGALNTDGNINVNGNDIINANIDGDQINDDTVDNTELQNQDDFTFNKVFIPDGGRPGGQELLQVGDDAYITDIDNSNTLGVQGVQDGSVASIKIGSAGPLISGTSSGNLDLNNNEIVGLSDPTDPQDAATRSYVENNDDQDLSIGNDPSGGGQTTINIDNGNSATFTDDFEANTNTQNPINGDLVAGNGLSGGNDNVLPGGNQDVTVSLNADDLDGQGNINDFSAASDLNQNGDISSFDNANDLDQNGGISSFDNANDLDGQGNINDFSAASDLNQNGDISSFDNANDLDGQGNINDFSAASDLNQNGDISSFDNANDLNSGGSLKSGVVADNEISDNTIDSSEIQNGANFDFNGEVDVGGGKIIVPTGTNAGL